MTRSKGFTLIEVVIVIVLFALVSIVLAEMYIGQHKIFQVQFSEVNVQGAARLALDDIDNNVRLATRVLSTSGSYTGGATTLILNIQSINASNQLLPGTYDVIVYHLSGSRLLKETIPNASSFRLSQTKELAADVTSLTFLYNNVDFTQVTEVATDINIRDVNFVETRSISASTKTKLRNY